MGGLLLPPSALLSAMVAVASGGHAACPTRAPTTDRQRGSGTVGSAWQWVTLGILMTLSHVAQGDLIEHAMDKDREAAAKGKGFSWEVRPEIVAELATLPDIPKKLHIFWPDAGVVNSPDPMVQHGIRKMIDLNPDWTWKVYEHKDIGDYIRAELDRAHPVLSKEDVEMMMKVRRYSRYCVVGRTCVCVSVCTCTCQCARCT